MDGLRVFADGVNGGSESGLKKVSSQSSIPELDDHEIMKLLEKPRSFMERHRSFDERSLSELSIGLSRGLDNYESAYLPGPSGLDTSASSTRNSFEPHPMVADVWEALRRSMVHFRGQPVGTIAAYDHASEEVLNYDQTQGRRRYRRKNFCSAERILAKGNGKGNSMCYKSQMIFGSLAGGLILDRMTSTIPNAFKLLSFATLFWAVFYFAAFCFKSLYAFLVVFTIGELLIFATQAPVNFVCLHTVKPSLRPIAMAISTVSIHIFGDVPSSPLVGLLQDHINSWRATALVLTSILFLAAAIWFIGVFLHSVDRYEEDSENSTAPLLEDKTIDETA